MKVRNNESRDYIDGHREGYNACAKLAILVLEAVAHFQKLDDRQKEVDGALTKSLIQHLQDTSRTQ
jgi:hypothetical protein